MTTSLVARLNSDVLDFLHALYLSVMTYISGTRSLPVFKLATSKQLLLNDNFLRCN